MKTKLNTAWTQQAKLHAEGAKLYAERGKLNAEGDKLYAEGSKLYAEGDKLYAEGNKLHAEGNLVFINAVIAQCGKDARIEWTDTGCIVQGVMEFLNETR